MLPRSQPHIKQALGVAPRPHPCMLPASAHLNLGLRFSGGDSLLQFQSLFSPSLNQVLQIRQSLQIEPGAVKSFQLGQEVHRKEYARCEQRGGTEQALGYSEPHLWSPLSPPYPTDALHTVAQAAWARAQGRHSHPAPSSLFSSSPLPISASPGPQPHGVPVSSH